MKNKLLLVIAPLLLFLISCDNKEGLKESYEQSIGESSISEEITSKDNTSTISEEPSEENDRFILKYSFDEAPLIKGSKVSGEEGKSNLDKLLEDMKNEWNSPYQSLSATGAVFFNEWGNEGRTTLILGSQSDSGSITFNSYYQIVSYKIEYQAYWKYISYNSTYSIDGDTTLVINDEIKDIKVESIEEAPEIKTIYKELEPNTNSLTLNNVNAKARVLIHSLTLEYIYTGPVD